MFHTITLIQPKGSGGGSEFSREQIVSNMTSNILEKLPPVSDMFSINERLKLMSPTQPMHIFVGQEIDRFQKVIVLVKNTLEDLLLAIDEIIIMNETITKTLDYMYKSCIPLHWLRISWMSLTIGFWFDELQKRHFQIHSWVYKNKPNQFWMIGFFNPQGFLTAIKQKYLGPTKVEL